MNTIIRKLGCWLTPVLCACSTVALAQDKPAGFPVRPIRIIIGTSPGAGRGVVVGMIELADLRLAQDFIPVTDEHAGRLRTGVRSDDDRLDFEREASQ